MVFMECFIHVNKGSTTLVIFKDRRCSSNHSSAKVISWEEGRVRWPRWWKLVGSVYPWVVRTGRVDTLTTDPVSTRHWRQEIHIHLSKCLFLPPENLVSFRSGMEAYCSIYIPELKSRICKHSSHNIVLDISKSSKGTKSMKRFEDMSSGINEVLELNDMRIKQVSSKRWAPPCCPTPPVVSVSSLRTEKTKCLTSPSSTTSNASLNVHGYFLICKKRNKKRIKWRVRASYKELFHGVWIGM